MPWWWNYAFLAFFVGWAIGNFFGKRQAKKSADQEIHLMKIYLTVDRRHYMGAVRRILGNEMMRRDHRRFVELKARAVAEVERISKLTKVACEEEFAVFARQHPNLNDFDPFHDLRDHLLFSDDWSSWETLEQHYLCIVRFSTLQNKLDDNWSSVPTTREDLEHAREYAQRIDDTRLWLRMKVAMDDWQRYRKDATEQFEGRDFSLCRITKDGESRVAVEFKNPVEYGLVSGWDSYASSDAMFESERGIGYQTIEGVTLPSPPRRF
jgi:hypothetical protein